MIKFNFKKCFFCSFVAVSISQSGCIDYGIVADDRLAIVNKSNVDISVLATNQTDEDNLTPNNIAFYIDDYNIIKPDSLQRMEQRGTRDAWDYYIAEGRSKKLYIYIFALDTLTKYNNGTSMNYLCSSKKYLQKKACSKDDLD